MLQAFPYQRFGTVHGQGALGLEHGARPDRNLHPGPQHPGAGVPRPRRARSRESISAYGETIPLQPGMLLSAEIVFDRRSLLQWLFDPIYAVGGRIMNSLAADQSVPPPAPAGHACRRGGRMRARLHRHDRRYHGHDVDLNGLRQRFSLSLAGASLRSLMGLADQLGFSTRALRVELSARCQGAACRRSCTGTSIISSC